MAAYAQASELGVPEMKRVAIVAMLAAVVAAACVWHNKSDSPTVSENTGGNPQHANAAVPVSASPSPSPSPSPQLGYVADSASVMEQSSRKQLETTLAALKQRDKIDFAVVTLESTGNQSARDYSLDLARDRNRHISGNENGGLLLLVAVHDHTWHVQVSRSLEDKLTDDILKTLSRPMIDSFKQKRYGEGIIKYVNAIISKLAELHSSQKGKAVTP